MNRTRPGARSPSGDGRHRTLLPLLSGALIGATFTPLGGPAVPFLAFAPAAHALRSARGAGSGIRLGFLVGCSAHAIGLYWMVPALAWRNALALPTYLMVLLVIGVVSAAAFEGARHLHTRFRCPLAVALAVCWVAFEWAAARVPGLPYAWLNVGGSLAWYPALNGVTPWLGAGGLTFWTVAAGATVGVGAGRGGPSSRQGVALVSVLLILPALIGWAGGTPRSEAPPNGTLVAVQTGRRTGETTSGGVFEPWRAPVSVLVAESQPTMVVFPERFLDQPPDTDRSSEEFAAEVGVPVLVGGPGIRVGADGDSAWYNAGFLIVPEAWDPPGGVTQPPPRDQVGYKSRLVPGLEDGGGGFNAFLNLQSRGYRRGPGPVVFRGLSAPFGLLICYDSAFPALTRRLVSEGAEFAMVLSNDDWMDPRGPERVTWAYWQHETQAKLRALENRIPVIQVASTGHTFALDGQGRRSSVMGAQAPGGAPAPPPFDRAVVALPIYPPGAPALFTKTGDLLGLVCFGLWVVALLPFSLPGRPGSPTADRQSGGAPLGVPFSSGH